MGAHPAYSAMPVMSDILLQVDGPSGQQHDEEHDQRDHDDSHADDRPCSTSLPLRRLQGANGPSAVERRGGRRGHGG